MGISMEIYISHLVLFCFFSILEETPIPVDRDTPEKDPTQLLLDNKEDKNNNKDDDEQEMMEHMSNLLITNDNIEIDDEIGLADEATINYSNDMSVSKLIDYYEEHQPTQSNNHYFVFFTYIDVLILNL